jgi:mono/diheme cytochrome c family protein
MRRRRRTLALLAAALLSVAMAACGTTDDEGEKTVADETQSTPAEQEPEQPLSPAEERGRTLFVETCGSCHTLDAAGTQGQVGPDLNELQVDEAQVLRAIEVGGTGSGTMPAGLYKGKDAQDVATFVANSGPGV